MDSTQLLPGITQHKVQTDRLEVAYIEAGAGSTPLVLVHGNCSSSLFFQDFMLALATTGRYKVYAIDLRGYGDSEVSPVDATRGLRDFSDDLDAFTAIKKDFLLWSKGKLANCRNEAYCCDARTNYWRAWGSPYLKISL